MVRRLHAIGATALLIAALSLPASASATPLAPFIDLQEKGLTLVDDGVGLEGKLAAGPASLTVNVGGVVRFALLYWGGRDRPCPQAPPGTCTVPSQPYKDQQMVFNGTPVTGTLIGTEGQPATDGGPTNNIGYFADVTSLVSAAGTGVKTFTLADGNLTSDLFRLDGASLVVAFTDSASQVTYRTIIWDGLDFAFANDPTPGSTRETTAIEMTQGTVAFARTGALTILAGDATAAGTDRITISNNADVVACLNGSAGARWDSDTVPISVPGGVAKTNVRVISDPGPNPDEVVWMAAALRVPVDAPSLGVVNDCPPPPAGGGLVDLKPELTALRVQPKALVAAKSGQAILSASTGATVSYSSSEQAVVDFRVQRARKGVVVKGACVKRRPSNKGRKGCKRYVTLKGGFSDTATAGPNSFQFSGRLKNRKLPVGSYRLVAVARDTAGQLSQPAFASFRIKPAGKRRPK